MTAVEKHIASVIAQNGGDIDGGEENQGRVLPKLGTCQTHRTKAAGKVNVEKTLDYFVGCSRKKQLKNNESKPHSPTRGEVKLQCIEK